MRVRLVLDLQMFGFYKIVSIFGQITLKLFWNQMLIMPVSTAEIFSFYLMPFIKKKIKSKHMKVIVLAPRKKILRSKDKGIFIST